MSHRLDPDRVRAALERVTPEAAALACGVTVGTIHNWRTGKTVPRGDRLVALAALAGRSPSWLFTKTREASQEEER